MNKINILYHPKVILNQDAGFIHELLDSADRQNIDETAWKNKNYLGNCSYAVLYGKDAIAIKYYVTEEQIKAVYNKPNDPVYKDSCVEFFIALDNDIYYNFEFNCNGTCLAQIGKDKQNRDFLPVGLINNIKSFKSLKTVNIAGAQLINWQLTVIIPFSLFTKHPVNSLEGKECRVNFYKCGDDLAEPHFLCWNKVETENPDFHRPEYFGTAVFLKEAENGK